MEETYRKLYRLGAVAYVLLLAFSIVFYKERTVFTDIAYHLFCILKDGDFAFQNYRYGAVVTQVFPLIGAKLSLSLKTILILYSACFIVYYMVCYWVCSMFRQYHIGVVLLVSQLLMATNTFYWMISELQLGLAFMMVVCAYILSLGNDKIKWYQWPIVFMLVFASEFFHPLLAFTGIFMFVYLILTDRIPVNKRLVIISLIVYLAVLIVKTKYFNATDDRGKMGNIRKFRDLFPDYFTIRSNIHFLKACMSKYYWLPIGLSLVVVRYIKDKKWVLLLWLLVCFFGYLLLINVSYADANVADFYIENFYLPLSVMITVPLLFDVLPSWTKRQLTFSVIALILASGIIRIYLKHDTYTARLNWERDFLRKNKNTKLILDEKTQPMDVLIMTWGTSYEFWLLSTIEKGQTASLMITDKLKEFSVPAMWEDKAMITPYGVYDYKDLPAQYFIFTDTVSKYKLVQ